MSCGKGMKFTQPLVDQRPTYDKKSLFRKKLKPGRPAKGSDERHWVK